VLGSRDLVSVITDHRSCGWTTVSWRQDTPFRADDDDAGQSSLGARMYESVSLVHSGHCPLPEGVRTACRIAHDLAAGGNFDKAMEMLRTAKDELSGGVLKLEQRVMIFEMLILLKKSVHA